MSDRITWAVQTLAVDPTDHILEIGCGHGVAVSLICPQLTTGTITALDRSPAMIAAAQKRSAGCERVKFITADLDQAEFAPAQFSKIFAVNVNLFWQPPAPELALLQRWLRPGGNIYLFYQPPDASKNQKIVATITDLLPTAPTVLHQDLKPIPGVAIII